MHLLPPLHRPGKQVGELRPHTPGDAVGKHEKQGTSLVHAACLPPSPARTQNTRAFCWGRSLWHMRQVNTPKTNGQENPNSRMTATPAPA